MMKEKKPVQTCARDHIKGACSRATLATNNVPVHRGMFWRLFMSQEWFEMLRIM